jgi:uncharacterized protein (TIGR02145 family)
MKQFFFFFSMLASITASAQVTNVAPVGANYANKTVSFRVWWNAGSRNATHLAKVWVWVDYIQVNNNNTTSGNTWTRATVGTVSGGVTSYDGSNRKGFWLEGNASTNYSGTLTVQLTNVPDKFNWCAYVSDFPPNVTINNGTYTFKGTPPFTLIAANGTTTQTVTGKTLLTSALNIIPATIRDKTECPGVFCPYQGSDLYIDATHLCQQRTSGAQNWEAWIKDTRDNELYRIVLMPDNKWWLAQNLKYASTGVLYPGCGKEDCGMFYNETEVFSGSYTVNRQYICPVSWVIPSNSQWSSLTSKISSTLTTAWRDLRSLKNPCTRTNRYGWASTGRDHVYQSENGDVHWGTNGSTGISASLDDSSGTGIYCDSTDEWLNGGKAAGGWRFPVRCLRP